MTDKERKDVMTREEHALAQVQEAHKQELTTAPKMLPGMAKLDVKVTADFEAAMDKMTDADGRATVIRLTESEELSGELLEDIENPTKLRGRLPADQPRFVILRVGVTSGWLLATWLPQDCGIKDKMKASTFKTSVLAEVKKRLEERLGDGVAVAQTELSGEDDLEEDPMNMISRKASLTHHDTGSVE